MRAVVIALFPSIISNNAVTAVTHAATLFFIFKADETKKFQEQTLTPALKFAEKFIGIHGKNGFAVGSAVSFCDWHSHRFPTLFCRWRRQTLRFSMVRTRNGFTCDVLIVLLWSLWFIDGFPHSHSKHPRPASKFKRSSGQSPDPRKTERVFKESQIALTRAEEVFAYPRFSRILDQKHTDVSPTCFVWVCVVRVSQLSHRWSSSYLINNFVLLRKKTHRMGRKLCHDKHSARVSGRAEDAPNNLSCTVALYMRTLRPKVSRLICSRGNFNHQRDFHNRQPRLLKP